MCDNHVFADWLLRMYDLLVGSMHNDNLSSLMNGPIRKKLGIIPSHVTWGGMVYAESFSWCFFKLPARLLHQCSTSLLSFKK